MRAVVRPHQLTTDIAASSPIPNSGPIVSLPEENGHCESDVIYVQKTSLGKLF
jgi:hypothetical protein